jgi:hypothetical protein
LASSIYIHLDLCRGNGISVLTPSGHRVNCNVCRLMIITGAMSIITAVAFFLYFPDSPTTAKFLTQEERIIAIQRVKVNQTGTQNKHFKKEQ